MVNFVEPQAPVKLAEEYSVKTTIWKGVKMGLAALFVALLADPTFLPSLTELIPSNYRFLAALAIPPLVSAIKNYIKQQQAAA